MLQYIVESHRQSENQPDVKQDINMCADNCGGQTKNIFLLFSLLESPKVYGLSACATFYLGR